eukprot:TRINITY_DN10214_c0_g1_i1.p1 TRINITY_DN10214_c0_g1~~TRINITY_DN10214_c0_g1_i1.p1  ORF type:complete len:464 (-),score=75.41 TRINITY_DN10214_c0_g1_i1:73-1464(-)
MKAQIILSLFGLLLLVTALPSDRIVNLPGLPENLNFDQYSGYITVDEVAGRALFYWFVESQSSPATDPLVIWLTGGPGCSSLLGLFIENGPFSPDQNGKTLSLNPYSWNKVANVIYLESPAGVGFSYSNNTQDYFTNDTRTASDSYQFLLGFFSRFPSFVGRDFWITGESYGGHYVPELARTIIEKNAKNNQPLINLKGFMVGNAWTYMPIDNLGAIETWANRAIVPVSTVDEIKKYCNLSHYGPLDSSYFTATACDQAVQKADDQMGNISIYDIYADVCVSSNIDTILTQYARLGSKIHNILRNKSNKRNLKSKQEIDPCEENYLTEYLNLPTVQSAIHSRPITWASCSSIVSYSFADVSASVIPTYLFLFDKNIDILVYSGDVDAIVPVLGTQLWINSLNLPIKEDWRPWYDYGMQVGGFVTVYDKLTFSTVRNAGHQVPWYQPERAFILFSNFLKRGKLP